MTRSGEDRPADSDLGTETRPRTGILSELCGQVLAKRIIETAIAQNRLAHAYLLAGPDGTGKSLAAFGLAEAVLSSTDREHPDLHVFAPADDRRSFQLSQVHEIAHRAAFRAHTAACAVFICKQAERLTGPAAAALLKIVEEPPGRAHFLLLAERAGRVEPTLRSRCQVIPFRPVPAPELEDWLQRRGVTDAATLARLAAGNPGRALAMADDPAWRETLDRAAALGAAVGEGDVAAELRRAADAAEHDDLLAALAGVLRAGYGETWPLEALEAWSAAEAAMQANVNRRLTWEILLLRLRRARRLRYDGG